MASGCSCNDLIQSCQKSQYQGLQKFTCISEWLYADADDDDDENWPKKIKVFNVDVEG